jgi:hypothetical protein
LFTAIFHSADFPQITRTMKKIKAGRYGLWRGVQTFRKIVLGERFSFPQQGQ